MCSDISVTNDSLRRVKLVQRPTTSVSSTSYFITIIVSVRNKFKDINVLDWFDDPRIVQ